MLSSAGAIEAMMYATIQKRIGSVGIHIAVGRISMGKSNCAQIVLSAVGNYPGGYTIHLSESVARSYLRSALPFVYDDPKNLDVLKPLLMNAFGGAKMSTQHGEHFARCTPIVTANDEILDNLATCDERYVHTASLLSIMLLACLDFWRELYLFHLFILLPRYP